MVGAVGGDSDWNLVEEEDGQPGTPGTDSSCEFVKLTHKGCEYGKDADSTSTDDDDTNNAGIVP